jgi:hypothetical protein
LTFSGGFVDLGNSYKVSKKLTRKDIISFLKSVQILTESIMEISYPKGRISDGLAMSLFSNLIIGLIKEEFLKIKTKSPLTSLFQKFYCDGFRGLNSGINLILNDNLEEKLKIII